MNFQDNKISRILKFVLEIAIEAYYKMSQSLPLFPKFWLSIQFVVNKEVFVDFMGAQIKTLSFLAYIIRIYQEASPLNIHKLYAKTKVHSTCLKSGPDFGHEKSIHFPTNILPRISTYSYFCNFRLSAPTAAWWLRACCPCWPSAHTRLPTFAKNSWSLLDIFWRQSWGTSLSRSWKNCLMKTFFW